MHHIALALNALPLLPLAHVYSYKLDHVEPEFEECKLKPKTSLT
jgi:hypothetical protein